MTATAITAATHTPVAIIFWSLCQIQAAKSSRSARDHRALPTATVRHSSASSYLFQIVAKIDTTKQYIVLHRSYRVEQFRSLHMRTLWATTMYSMKSSLATNGCSPLHKPSHAREQATSHCDAALQVIQTLGSRFELGGLTKHRNEV